MSGDPKNPTPAEKLTVRIIQVTFAVLMIGSVLAFIFGV